MNREDNVNELLSKLENISNLLRWVALDPVIPEYIKIILTNKAKELDGNIREYADY